MLSGRAGEHEKQGTAQSGSKNGRHLKVAPSDARPGSKGLAPRNHEAPLIPWNGRASGIADCRLRNADWGKKPKKSKIRNPKFNGPMLSARKAFAPGPQPKRPGNVEPYDSPSIFGSALAFPPASPSAQKPISAATGLQTTRRRSRFHRPKRDQRIFLGP
jgi:hypothetical protein